MTPIYRSPDQEQTKAIQSLLLDHQIQASIIESKKSDPQYKSPTVIWYELWLKNYSELNRARTIITQHEFTAFKSQMSTFKTSVETIPDSVQPENNSNVEKFPTIEQLERDDDEVLVEDRPMPVASKPRDDLIPINNKRVFKRLGLLLGFTEEEIEKTDNNKLYRPWDADSLMETVKNLKRKCS
ncbi:hypothetical protein [Kaarinaea lacus]